MAKQYESEDTVVYQNENGDTWIKNTETDERTYIPSGSTNRTTFDHEKEINNDDDE